MTSKTGRLATALGAGVLVLGLLAVGAPQASAAAPAGAVPFANANFHGYANGDEIHVGALTLGTTKLVDLEQALSGASTSTSGLGGGITNEDGVVVQPPESSSVNAYGGGSGLEVGLGTSTTALTDTNQIILDGKAQNTALPNAAPTTKQIGPINLSPIADASLLTGRSAAIWDPTTCPIGQPISYGFGDAANVNALDLGTSVGGPVVNTAGSATTTAQSYSDTYLSPNGDGTFGLSSQGTDVIAPVTANILGIAKLEITVQGTNGIDNPVSLTAKTTGESSGGSVTLSGDDVLKVVLIAGSSSTTLVDTPISTVGTHVIPLNTSQLGITLDQLDQVLGNIASTLPGGSALQSILAGTPVQNLLSTVGSSLSSVLTAAQLDLSLGSIDIDAVPHAIGGPVTATNSASVTGGTSASGAIDLVKVNLGLTGSIAGMSIGTALANLLNLEIGHLEASASASAPIQCSIPVLKTSSSPTVTAGNSFSYTIQVPNPAKLALLDCSLSNVTVTDVIGDEPGTGAATFNVTSASNGGTINQTSPTSATVTWTGLHYPPDIQLTIGVSVPKDSPSGTIQDTATATGTATGCTGGAAGSTSAVAAATTGTVLTGSITIELPSVVGVAVKPPPKKVTLPFTGAIGGPWQPIAGAAVLGAGVGALALVRRSRLRRRRAS